MRHRALLLWNRVRLRQRTFLLGRPYRLNRPLLGGWPHLLSQRWLLYWASFLSPIDWGPGSLHWHRNRLTPFNGKRLGNC